jgi:hypothetical protein
MKEALIITWEVGRERDIDLHPNRFSNSHFSLRMQRDHTLRMLGRIISRSKGKKIIA